MICKGCFSHHASFIVANHSVVASCQPLDLYHLKSYIQTIGQSICTWEERTNQGEEGLYLHISAASVATVSYKTSTQKQQILQMRWQAGEFKQCAIKW